MADILFNEKGAPLMISSKSAFFATKGYPDNVTKQLTQSNDTKQQDTVQVGTHKILSWNSSNDFPQWADKIITSTGVLNTGLKFIRNFTLGQGIYACTIEGYDDKGNEILKPYPDQSVSAFLNSRVIRRYMEKTLRDYLKFGPGFVQLIPNADGSRIVGLNPINAFYARLTEADSYGFKSVSYPGNGLKLREKKIITHIMYCRNMIHLPIWISVVMKENINKAPLWLSGIPGAIRILTVNLFGWLATWPDGLALPKQFPNI